MIRNFIRGVITVLFGALGFYLDYILLELKILESYHWALSPVVTYVAMIVLFSVLGFLSSPGIIRVFLKLIRWLELRLSKTPTYDILGGAIGVIIGLIIASLLSNAVSAIPLLGSVFAIILSITFGYLGLMIGLKRKEDVLALFAFIPKLRGDKGDKSKDPKNVQPNNPDSMSANYKILDTSVIIDGRIADIVQTGFIEGTLLIPGFVLEELRHIADSSDLLKRNRGRRGLDILNQISKEATIKVETCDKDFDDIAEVDSKLIRLGQVLNAPVFTNDYNLNKVAEFQGVKVLNINELANAIKPVVLPGEEMIVQVMKEGKEHGQGIAYLDDGTMIVVDTGKRFIGQTLVVLVTSVLQTAAGRMIFAKPKVLVDKKALSLASNEEVNALG